MQPDDGDLMGRCLQGDNRAFDCLVHRYQRQVLNFCYRMLGNVDDAADAAQDAFVKAYYSLGSFRRDAEFLTWLLKIASNSCIDRSRRRTRRKETSLDNEEGEGSSLPAPDPSPEETVLQQDHDARVREAIMALPEKNRVAIVLFYLNNMSIKEICAITGRPEGTVKSDLHYGREKLRRELEGVVVHELHTSEKSTP